MKNDDPIQALAALYTLYDEFMADYSLACFQGCSLCCTPNVIITSLEGRYLLADPAFSQNPELFELIHVAGDRPLYHPSTTINQTAAACLAGQEPPEDTGVHQKGSCILLDEDGLCRVYAHRPFACRAMVSKTKCQAGEPAEMPDFLVTVNYAVHQIIEHLDNSGMTGALPEVVDCLSENQHAEEKDLLQNQSLPGFLIPPDDQEELSVFLKRLAQYPVVDGTLGEWLRARR